LKDKIYYKQKSLFFQTHFFGTDGGTRTHKALGHKILSHARIPIPPRRHV
jgi:hypothetical protein